MCAILSVLSLSHSWCLYALLCPFLLLPLCLSESLLANRCLCSYLPRRGCSCFPCVCCCPPSVCFYALPVLLRSSFLPSSCYFSLFGVLLLLFLRFRCCRCSPAGFAGRDLHKPSPAPLIPEAGGLCCIFCFLSAATAGQLLLDRHHQRVRATRAAVVVIGSGVVGVLFPLHVVVCHLLLSCLCGSLFPLLLSLELLRLLTPRFVRVCCMSSVSGIPSCSPWCHVHGIPRICR